MRIINNELSLWANLITVYCPDTFGLKPKIPVMRALGPNNTDCWLLDSTANDALILDAPREKRPCSQRGVIWTAEETQDRWSIADRSSSQNTDSAAAYRESRWALQIPLGSLMGPQRVQSTRRQHMFCGLRVGHTPQLRVIRRAAEPNPRRRVAAAFKQRLRNQGNVNNGRR